MKSPTPATAPGGFCVARLLPVPRSACPGAAALLGLLLGLFPWVPALRAAAPTPSRPNILWVVIEDTHPRFVGPYGHPLARTPAADRLAQTGIVFEQVFTAPVCAPSRNSLATGRFAHSQGTHHMRSSHPLPPDAGYFSAALRSAGYYCVNNAKSDYNTSTPWTGAWDENSNQAHWRNRGAGQPFFAMFTFTHSHESQLHTRKPLVTDPARVDVPGHLPDTPVVRADIAQAYDNVAVADAAVARILADLEADGLAEDTIIFYFADNGGMIPGSKRFPNDLGTHVPLIVHFPARYAHLAPGAPGSRSAELVNFVDFAPTALSLAGVSAPTGLQGRAFAGPARQPAPAFTFIPRGRMDERPDESRIVTDGRYHYVRNYHPHQPWGVPLSYLWRQASMQEWHLRYRSKLLTPLQSRFFEPKGAEELYDTQADPDNTRNLAADPAHRTTLLRLREALRAHQLAVRDTGLMPETMMIEAAAGHSPGLVAADDGAYPLAPLLDLVDQLQREGPEAAARAATGALTHPHPAFRYWAARAALQYPDAIEVAPLLGDPDATVRLAAAEARLVRMDDPAAMAVIEAALQQTERPELRLLALNALATIPQPPTGAIRLLLGSLAAESSSGGFGYYLARAARPLLEK